MFLCSSTFSESQLKTSKPDEQGLLSSGSTSAGLAGAVTATDAAAGRDTTAGTSQPSTALSGSEYQQHTFETERAA